MLKAENPAGGASGAGDIHRLTAVNVSHIKSPSLKNQGFSTQRIDPRLAFLARAAARFELFEGGEIGLAEAVDGLFPAFAAITDRRASR
jgi:hypothetical protein